MLKKSIVVAGLLASVMATNAWARQLVKPFVRGDLAECVTFDGDYVKNKCPDALEFFLTDAKNHERFGSTLLPAGYSQDGVSKVRMAEIGSVVSGGAYVQFEWD